VVGGVQLDGLGEVLNGFLVALCLEGLVAFVFELEGCLLIAHK
jgi:hypothetical protein